MRRMVWLIISTKQDIWNKTNPLIKIRFYVPEICSRIRRMICGYARVSTEAQDLTSQLAQLKGCEKVSARS